MMERVLSPDEIGELLLPYLSGEVLGEEGGTASPLLLAQLSRYLGLLLRWNERMNLTSVPEGREMVRRHFGESLFLARHLSGSGRVLDFGSGAGFPGIPIQLWHPGLAVVLAESQGKKASFLREAVRSLGLPTEIWGRRVEDLPAERMFEAVVMRAVDRTAEALRVACGRTLLDVWLLGSAISVAGLPERMCVAGQVRIPETEGSFLFRLQRRREL